MSSPSEKEILKAFPEMAHGKAKELADKLAAAVNSDENDAIDEVMEFANEAINGNGVEAIQGDGAFIDKFWRDTVLVYVNMGDTYDQTILYDTESSEFSVGSWGDFMEEWEKEDEEEDYNEAGEGDGDDGEEEEGETEEEDAETEEAE